MSIETVKTYLKPFGLAERVQELGESSATVELAAQAVGDLAEHLQRGFVQQGVTIPFWKLYFLHPITKLLCTQAQYYK